MFRTPKWDHPRSRGEYHPAYLEGVVRTGSSPLSRGIRHFVGFAQETSRIIPALAGNTGHVITRVTRIPDHPRSRGEYTHSVEHDAIANGSSPLSRGIPCLARASMLWAGIIPALAGNTVFKRPQLRFRRDHPRSRGEYLLWTALVAYIQGSSPLSRGIRQRLRSGVRTPGIIPALAGNTWCRCI